MAILTANKPRTAHWYTREGQPMHTMMKADGSGERTTTLRDARKLKLFPSVTGILTVLAKPSLEKWKLDQVALASLRCPKQVEEGMEYWCNRVQESAFEQVDEAAELGSSIHDALETATLGEPWDQALAVYVNPVLAWLAATGFQIVEREKVVVNVLHGFAGKSDVLFRSPDGGFGVLDYKTKKTKPGKAVESYEDQAMQVAAYAGTYWGEACVGSVLAVNVYISTSEPGRMEVVKHDDLGRHWRAFLGCAELWRYFREYDPRV